MKNKKSGVWGLGVSGRAVLHYLLNNNHNCAVLDRTEPSNMDELFAKNIYNTPEFYLDSNENSQKRDAFLNSCDIIIPSPGIDLRPYAAYSKKILSEIDLFQMAWNQDKARKIIAITGTLGKTSITHLLNTILNTQKKTTITGGNIGIGMLDLIESPEEQALLELSSFQLEHAKNFAPDLAIWTNFFPNHLDRHTDLSDYFAAKKNILLNQKTNQKALIPVELASELRTDRKLAHRPLAFFCADSAISDDLLADDILYSYDKTGNITRNDHIILAHDFIPKISYKNNWLIIAAALDLLNLDTQKMIIAVKKFTLPDYRLEKVATINGITYYNDSKSTIMQATVAAVNEIQNGPIVLLLGGLCKGVDRSQFIKQLANKVHSIICFGAEASLLQNTCTACTIPASAYSTLEEALTAITQSAQAGTSVLFSPGGASFDLFKNYQARGERFKELVLMLKPQEN